MFAHSLPAISLPLLLALPAADQPLAGPVLAIANAPNAIVATITDASPDFLGAVIASDSDRLTHYLAVVPPLLSDFVILGIGQAQNGSLTLVVPHMAAAVDLEIFAQGVTLDLDSMQLASSAVEALVIPAAR